MKIRIKFAKTGSVKFVGHLDMQRFFQKLIRRAKIDICYSEGFHPHQKMSFASPLGVGMPGQGEYVDIEVHTTPSSAEALRRLNQATVEGVPILGYRLLKDGALNAMSTVAAADYFIKFREGYEPEFDWKEKWNDFLSKPVIEIEKETKKSTAVVNIRPMIYESRFCFDTECLMEECLMTETKKQKKQGVVLKLAAGSVNNLKPELVFLAFYQYLQMDLHKFALDITRLAVYGNAGTQAAPVYKLLEDFGEVIL